MALSPRIPDVKLVIPPPFDVILLRIESSGDAKIATIAVAEDNFKSAAPLIASHDVFLAQHLH